MSLGAVHPELTLRAPLHGIHADSATCSSIPTYLPPIYLATYLSVYLYIYMYLSIYLSIYLSVYLSKKLSIYLYRLDIYVLIVYHIPTIEAQGAPGGRRRGIAASAYLQSCI